MNLWSAVRSAKNMRKAERIEECENLIYLAERILDDYRVSGSKNPIAICCYNTEAIDGKITVWCTKQYFDEAGNKIDEGRHAEGTPDERPDICRACRVSCEEELGQIKKALEAQNHKGE